MTPLKRELARVTEERDILKKAAAYFARDCRHASRLAAEGNRSRAQRLTCYHESLSFASLLTFRPP